MTRSAAAVACFALLTGLLAPAGPLRAQTPELALKVVATGLRQPVAFVQDPSNPRVQYVVERRGRIRVLVDGSLQPTDLIDLSGAVTTANGEQGLLGLALPADYGTTGLAFVNFTNEQGHTVVARFSRARDNPTRLDPASRLDLRWSTGARVIAQPFANHNGGTLRFGPDGYLYIGLGDGGSGNDPLHAAQNPTTLLGKMLRVDVRVPASDPDGLRIPPDNPFLGGQPVQALPEIWAFGLRNPWKFAFDDPWLGGTGALLIADVGQAAREEINHEPPGAGGRNYGWRLREGTLPGGAGPQPPAAFGPLVDPIHEYDRAVGRSITGGQVYRGNGLPSAYRGRYFFGDFITGRLLSVRLEVDPATGDAVARDVRDHTAELGGPSALGNISSIDVDSQGELHVVDYGGRVLRLESARPDADADGLPDGWERRFGLDATRATGADGPSGDPDGDGLSNAAEWLGRTHPRGTHRYLLAEGATSATFFDVSINLLNPGQAPVTAVVRWLRADGTEITQTFIVGPERRLSVNPKGQPGLAHAEFSTVVESDQPLVVSRTMTWDVASRYGAHAEAATEAAAEWVLAEGATHSGFNLFYLLQNPHREATEVEITYLRPAPALPVVRRYALAPTSRRNIWVNLEAPELAATDVSAVVRALGGADILVERAMYRDAPGQLFGAGHASAGVRAPATEWLLAEGATGPFFDLFVLLANPGATAALVECRYLLPEGAEILRSLTLPPRSRLTLWVDHEDPRLAATAVSVIVRSLNGIPIVVERAMWWPGGIQSWYEAHASAGATRPAARWALAEGEVGGPDAADTYLLVASVGEGADTVTVRLLFEDRPAAVRTFPLGPRSRFTLRVADHFPEANGRRFGAVVESERGNPLVVEAALYANSGGTFWAAGANLLATPLPRP